MGPLDTGMRLTVLLLAWLAGVAAQLHERALLPLAAYIALVAVASLVGVPIACFRWRRVRFGVVVLALAAATAGYASAGWRASLRLGDGLPAELEGRDLVVTGVVASLPQQGASGTRFRFQLDADVALRLRLPARLTLGWYTGYHEDAAALQPQRALGAGQRWRFTVRLRQPHGNLNPHGFDYELLLFEQGVRATGYVRDAPAPVLLDAAAGFPVERLRQHVRDGIEARVADRRAAGVLAALAVGDQSAIDREDWELFRNTGVAHLMSISGLHVTMFAWLAGLGLGAAWRRSDRALLSVPAPVAARIGGLLAATAYAVFSGWGVPSQRTIWMLATVTLLQLAGLHWPWLIVLLAAAAVVTALDPWAFLQPGFWLSFAAVGLLMASAPIAGTLVAAPAAGWRGWPRRLLGSARSGLRTQVVATLGLAPLGLVFFQQVSLVGLLANVVAIPLVTLVVTPLALLGAAVAPLWTAGAAVVAAMSAGLQALGAVPGAVWTVAAAPLWAQLAGLLAAVLVVLPLPWRIKLFAGPLAIGLLLPPRSLPPEGGFDLVAADVGQGTAVLVRTRRHALLFDAGPQYSRESDAGQRVLVPLLRARGDARLDLLVLSHRDLDHVGGARTLLGAVPVAALASSLEPGHPLFALMTGDSRNARCEAGQRWTWDGVEFAFLRPDASDYALALKPNALSCVLRVAGGGRSALLSGDIERDQEARLVAAHGAALRTDVLVVPHHGSRTSSTAVLLDAVKPRLAVVQAGYRNRFGHPAADVLERYRERGAAVVVTPSCGAWTWRADGPAAGECHRETARRYWHHGASPRLP